jgi:hypothetical protein
MKFSAFQRTIITICLILSGLLIADSVNAGHAIIMLLIAGQIPGTDLYIPADAMLTVCAGIFGVLCGRATSRLLTYSAHTSVASKAS